MKKAEIQHNLDTIAQNIDQENFIYDFLASFGLSKTTITRLKKGDYNLSKNEGELFYKGKIFFKVEKQANLLNLIDELAKDEKIKKQKPRFIVVTDFHKVLAVDTKLGNNKEFQIQELGEQTDFFLPLSGAEIYRVSNDNKLDRDAAYKLGELYDILIADNPEWVANGSHNLNIFLSRLLFCFFAEDTGIFEQKSIFTEALVNNTAKDGSDVDLFLSTLFRKLNTPNGQGTFPSHFNNFPYVNGGLFRDDIQCPKFLKKARQILIDSGELDWSEINPDIFGSMIQAVADPAERNNLGMHYTSVVNILKLIKPLFLDDLYEEFEKNKGNVKKLEALLDRLGKIKFFDPACGSGNFLIITYKELRNLEIQIIKELIDLNTTQRKIYFSEIKLAQFYGIEIKDFAHEMAILSLWLAEHQMNQVFEQELLDYGKSNPILPLQQSGNITQGNAARVDWEQVCPKETNDEIYIIGNPPYWGASKLSEVQKLDIKISGLIPGKVDYVAAWFVKAVQFIKEFNAKAALVATNSICQGEQVPLIWKNLLSQKIEIDFAYTSFTWKNNAKGNAGVIVVIIGLRNISDKPKYLFSDDMQLEVKNINPYLRNENNTIVNKLSNQNKILKYPSPSRVSFLSKSEGLFFNEEVKNKIQNDENIKFIRELIGSYEMLQGIKKYCLYIDDEDLLEAKKDNFINECLYRVAQERKNEVNSHKFCSKKISDNIDYLVIPRISSINRNYLPVVILKGKYAFNDQVVVIDNPEPIIFGIVSSRMHMVWVRAVGGKMKNDYRYSSTICYNTFPFPTLSEKKKETINQYVFSVLDERAKYPEKTLAWLYNPETMPAGLKQAHKELDEAIERIYRLAPFNSDEERLEYLFKLYDEMTTKESLFAKPKKTTKKK